VKGMKKAKGGLDSRFKNQNNKGILSYFKYRFVQLTRMPTSGNYVKKHVSKFILLFSFDHQITGSFYNSNFTI